MLRLFHKAIGSEGLRSASLLTLGNVVSTGLGAIALILISRLSSPSDFGLFSVIFSLMLMASRLGDLGSNVALQRELVQPEVTKDVKAWFRLANTGFWLKVILSIFGLGLGLILSPWLSIVLKFEPQIYITLGFFAMIGIILFDYASILAQAKNRFGVAVFGASTQATLKIIFILILLGLGEFTVENLIILYGLAPFLAALLVIKLLGYQPRLVSVKDFTQTLSSLWSVMRWTLVAVVTSTLAENIDVLLVQSFLDSTQAGLFSAAVRIASFAAVASYSIGIVLNVRVAKYKTKEHVDSYLIKAALLAVGLMVLTVILAEFSHYLIYYTAGEGYLASIPALKLLLYSTGIVMATTPFTALFYSLNSPSYFAYSGLIMAAVLIVFDLLLIPSFGLIGAGSAKIIARLAVLVFTLLFALYHYRQVYVKN